MVRPSRGLRLRGSFFHLQQVLVNLLTNACKYTDAGSVQLRAVTERIEGPIATVRFSVEDTGQGVPPSQRERIFENYTQGTKPGTGLGLPLCVLLCKQMGSSLHLSSPPSGGTVFSFVVSLEGGEVGSPQPAAPHGPQAELEPAAQPSGEAAQGGTAAEAASERESLPTGLRVRRRAFGGRAELSAGGLRPFSDQAAGARWQVLVADDQRINRLLMRRAMTEVLRSPKLVEATTGEEALRLLLAEEFDIAVLDEIYDRSASGKRRSSEGACGGESKESEAECLLGTDVTRRFFAEAEPAAAARLIVVGCTGNAGTPGHSELARASGQHLVWGKPFPSHEQQLTDLVKLYRQHLSRTYTYAPPAPREVPPPPRIDQPSPTAACCIS